MSHDKISLEGQIEGVIFHNDENGYTVFSISPEAGDDEIVCTGFLSNPLEGENIKIEGTYVDNPKYGRQFSVTNAHRIPPSTLAGIEKYLASGIIKGIGAKTAKQIVARFGEKSFEVIESDPDKLSQIRGISLLKAVMMSEAFHAQHAQREAMLFLQENGITPAAAMKIYKRYKDETIESVRQNPYRLADDIDGIGFKTADAIAYRMGISRDAPARISAGVRYVLWEAANDGHTYMPTSALTRQAADLLICPPEIVENELARMQMERHIIREKLADANEPYVFVSALYYAEMKIAKKLFSLNLSRPDHPVGASFAREDSPREGDFNNGRLAELHPASRECAEADTCLRRQNPSPRTPLPKTDIGDGITLSESQEKAVESALNKGVLILTGGPGTGKTTVINTIIGLLEKQNLEITLAAPTGRAAKRMTEATGREAKTIHRMLEVSFISEDSRRQVFKKNEDEPLETDVLIVDECSMIDVMLMKNLLDAVPDGTRLILVGDVDQLPPVGAGNVLKDLIASDCLPVARLTEIFRQAAESAIITNAHRINKGQYPATNDKEKDFFFMPRNSPEDVAATILNLISERLPAYKNFDSIHDIQVLTPTRKSTLGVNALNAALQSKLNPPSRKKREREYGATVFREGDKVMQIRNNYDASWEIWDGGRRADFGEGVFNGDMGTILTIDDDEMCVIFDDNRRVNYTFSQLDELELAYAVTVHKSQGSEYRAVIIPLFGGPPMLLTRNLLYTAVTRARELAILVGTAETMHRMVDNNRVTHRYTALSRRLKDLEPVFNKSTSN